MEMTTDVVGLSSSYSCAAAVEMAMASVCQATPVEMAAAALSSGFYLSLAAAAAATSKKQPPIRPSSNGQTSPVSFPPCRPACGGRCGRCRGSITAPPKADRLKSRFCYLTAPAFFSF